MQRVTEVGAEKEVEWTAADKLVFRFHTTLCKISGQGRSTRSGCGISCKVRPTRLPCSSISLVPARHTFLGCVKGGMIRRDPLIDKDESQ